MSLVLSDLDPLRAKDIKNNLRLIIICELVEPYSTVDLGGSSPTLNDPYDSVITYKLVYSKVTEVILYNKSNGVIEARIFPIKQKRKIHPHLYRDVHTKKYGYSEGWDSKKILIDAIYEDAGEFKYGLARVKIGDKWTLIDIDGKQVCKLIYDYIWDYNGKRAKARLVDGSFKYLDGNGVELEY